jgi:hypothetical protein
MTIFADIFEFGSTISCTPFYVSKLLSSKTLRVWENQILVQSNVLTFEKK